MEFKKVKLSECCFSISDGDHMPPPKTSSGIPFITITNINDNNKIDFSNVMYVPIDYYDNLAEIRKAKANDIIYSVVGSFGKPVLVSEEDLPFVFQRHIAIIKANSTVSPQYLYYSMLNPIFYQKADKLAIGAAQRTVTLESLRNITIDVPNIEYQHKIAQVLSKIDAKISNNNRINDNLFGQSSMVA